MKRWLRLNRFTARLEASGELPWPRPGTGEVGDQWTDRDDAALRGYLERHYRISAPAKVMDALNIVSARHAYHPVLDYFGSLAWDGVPRMERCIIHALGTDGNRRFFFIKVDPALKGAGDTVAWLTENKDQIWAEADGSQATGAGGSTPWSTTTS